MTGNTDALKIAVGEPEIPAFSDRLEVVDLGGGRHHALGQAAFAERITPALGQALASPLRAGMERLHVGLGWCGRGLRPLGLE